MSELGKLAGVNTKLGCMLTLSFRLRQMVQASGSNPPESPTDVSPGSAGPSSEDDDIPLVGAVSWLRVATADDQTEKKRQS